jgi:hypothetical protein
MKRLALILIALGAMALPATAAAKEPTSVSIDGPGLDRAIVITGGGGSGGGTPFAQLVEAAGFFPATFGQQPSPMLADRPRGDLGPRYTLTYEMPSPAGGSDRIVQHVYPYADSAPVTFTPAGQPFFGVEQTAGGWYRADAILRDQLVDAGLPPQPAADPAPSADRVDGFRLTTLLIALAAAGIATLLGIAGAHSRRGPGAAPA